MRTVKFYTTLGKLLKVQTDATTWGELKVLAQEEGINTNELKAMVNVNKTTLDHDEAELPEGEFTVFFTKINSKAGVELSELSYREIRKKVKELVDSSPKAANYFNEDRNYTNKSKADLVYLLENWLVSDEVEEETTTQEGVELENHSVTLNDLLNQVRSFVERRVCGEEDEKFAMDIEDFLEKSELTTEEIEIDFNTQSVCQDCQEEKGEKVDPELLKVQEEGRKLGIL